MKIIKRSIASWVCSALLVSLLTVLRGGAGSLLSPDFASRTGLWLYAALFAAAFLFITAADRLIKVFSADNAALLLSVNLFALLALRYSDDITLLLGLMRNHRHICGSRQHRQTVRPVAQTALLYSRRRLRRGTGAVYRAVYLRPL